MFGDFLVVIVFVDGVVWFIYIGFFILIGLRCCIFICVCKIDRDNDVYVY